MSKSVTPSMTSLAASITKASSKQTYYTIRFLADGDRVEDAYRAYAYFRWVDDILDVSTDSRTARLAFINRQRTLLEQGYRGELTSDICPEEAMLFDLIRSDTEPNSGLQTYLRNMMAVMSFDAERRGNLVTQPELAQYTYWLASAVTEALHYFIGHGSYSPHGEMRYQAVTGAHITHMLRDTLEDAEAGYYNLPREWVTSHGVAPWDVKSNAYRDWVKEKVETARTCFKVGRAYLSGVESLRCRIAGYAYIRRFEIVLECIEREGCLLRADYPERKTLSCRIVMMVWALWMALKRRVPASKPAVYVVR